MADEEPSDQSEEFQKETPTNSSKTIKKALERTEQQDDAKNK